jgi:hypothetical protein
VEYVQDSGQDSAQPGDVPSLAALVSRQTLDLNTYAAFLLNSLDGALPLELIDVQRKSSLFGRTKPDAPILCVTVHLGEQRFVLQRPDPTRTPSASIAHEVAGIVLRTESVPLDAWSAQLAQALAQYARTNQATATALARITSFEV